MKLPTAGDPVPPPADLDLIAWYDLSPMRPDEFMDQNAWRWHEAVVLRNALDEGRRDAAREGETYQQLAEMKPQA